jgi:hypothetical protein
LSIPKARLFLDFCIEHKQKFQRLSLLKSFEKHGAFGLGQLSVKLEAAGKMRIFALVDS